MCSDRKHRTSRNTHKELWGLKPTKQCVNCVLEEPGEFSKVKWEERKAGVKHMEEEVVTKLPRRGWQDIG